MGARWLVVALLGFAFAAPFRAPGTPAPPGWQWPLRPGPDRVVRDFDPPPRPWLAGNRGVDLAGRAGEPVRAALGARAVWEQKLTQRGAAETKQN